MWVTTCVTLSDTPWHDASDEVLQQALRLVTQRCVRGRRRCGCGCFVEHLWAMVDGIMQRCGTTALLCSAVQRLGCSEQLCAC